MMPQCRPWQSHRYDVAGGTVQAFDGGYARISRFTGTEAIEGAIELIESMQAPAEWAARQPTLA
ncbi:hypothetical protein BCEN4_1200029 [Burkholderia cenocepacia]|nr:hypothetical protein BCEN4_1200029 [Burkholderia cenocepacia]